MKNTIIAVVLQKRLTVIHIKIYAISNDHINDKSGTKKVFS